MKIAIIGYGKMGHEIEAIALTRGHQIVMKIDKDNQHYLDNLKRGEVDIAIEFSTPATVYQNILKCINANVPIVVGTTGWLDKLEDVKSLVIKANSTLFYAPNYSIGVNLFFKLNRVLSNHINSLKNYSVFITETHHTQKIDAPSGTAITLAQIISESVDELNGWTLLPEKDIKKIPIESIREGTVPGTHVVTFDSELDEIIITHKAKSRKGFAQGAVLAAEFLAGKKGVFTMEDLLKF